MKKLLTLFTLALLPFISFAQDVPLFKDFANGVYGIRNSFKLNDHVNVTQVSLDGDSFAMIAVDENMTVLWNTTLKGHALSSGNFKGKILAELQQNMQL